MIIYEFSNEELRDMAVRYNNPRPTDNQCDALRLEVRNKMEVTSKNHTNFGCACDGKNTFIHLTASESLAFAFKK